MSSHNAEIYFSSIVSLFELSPMVKSIELVKKVSSSTEGYINLKLALIHNYTLDFFEYWNNGVVTDYRYNVRDHQDDVLVRWDNARHHPQVSTFPDHQHFQGDVYAAKRPGLIELLELVTELWK